MDEPTVEDHVVELQRDLADGDDLAQAIELISNALERRLRAVGDSLDELRDRGTAVDGSQLASVVRHLRATVGRHRSELRRRRDRIEELIEEFERTLDATLEELDTLDHRGSAAS